MILNQLNKYRGTYHAPRHIRRYTKYPGSIRK